jgi:RNA polymerase sigma factor (sigma-70 family)
VTRSECSDGDLLGEFADTRSESPFAELVSRHSPMVLSVCRSVLVDAAAAEDAAQDVFLTLARKAAELRGRDNVAGWLHQAAWHVARRLREANRIRAAREQEASRMQTPSTGQPAGDRPNALLVHREIERLPDKYRLAVVLHHLEGLSEAETARRLRPSPGAASMRLSRARLLLRGRLARHGVTVTAGGFAAFVAEQIGAMETPAGFVAATAHAAHLAAWGPAAAAGAAAGKAALAKGAWAVMAAAPFKSIATAVAVAGLLGVAGYGVAKRAGTSVAPTAPPAHATSNKTPMPAPHAPAASSEHGEVTAVNGSKITVDGKEYDVSGAKINVNGKEAKVDDLKVGMKASLTLNHHKVTAVDAKVVAAPSPAPPGRGR